MKGMIDEIEIQRRSTNNSLFEHGIHHAKDVNAADTSSELSDYLVEEIAKEFRHLGVPLDQIIEQGKEGLSISIDRYDPSMQILFIDYAKWWIKYKIHNFFKV